MIPRPYKQMEGLESIRHSMVFNTAGSFDIGIVLPEDTRVHSAMIDVTEVFDGAPDSTLTIGDAGSAARFCDTSEVDLTTIGLYEVANYHNYATATQVVGTYVQNGATQGAAYIEVLYSAD